MHITDYSSRKMTEDNIELIELVQFVVAALDESFNQDTSVQFKDLKASDGGENKEGDLEIRFSPKGLMDTFDYGFIEYSNAVWWLGKQNPRAWKGIMLLAIHEYAHTLFYKWGYDKKGIKPHSRQFMDICQLAYRRISMAEVYNTWRKSKVIVDLSQL